jgi:hypothetical protein
MRRRPIVRAAAVCALVATSLAMPVAAKETADEAPATQIRLALDRVLAEHAFLIVQVMRTGLTPGPEFNAAADTLDANTNDLVAAITSVYGKAAGTAFAEQWRNHIAFLVDYARALSTKDAAAAKLADSQLHQYVVTFSTLLAGAVQLPEAAVEGLIREHVEQLEQVAKFEASRFGEAYPAILETYQHMFMIGDALATAIVAQSPDRFPGQQVAFSPAIDLRIKLDRLFGAQTELAAVAMRAKLNAAADLAASTAALNQSTSELTEAISSVYGGALDASAAAQWQKFGGLFLAYVAAKKEGDTAAQSTAAQNLRQWGAALSGFLTRANPRISGATLPGLITAHTTDLVKQTDQYVSGSFAAAYSTQRAAFARSGELSAYLAAGIASQFPDRFPDTAFGHRRSEPQRHPGLQLIGLMLLVVAAVEMALVPATMAKPKPSRRRGSRR